MATGKQARGGPAGRWRRLRTSLDDTPTGALAAGGVAARAALHLVVAILAARLATGKSGGDEEASGAGAVEALSRQPGGRLLVGLVAVGLLAYGVWRLVQAAVGVDDGGVGRRALAATRGLFHLAFAVPVLGIVLRGSTGSGGSGGGRASQEQTLTARVLEWPAGPVLVVAAGLVVVGMGVANLVRAVRDDPSEVLDDARRPRGTAGASLRVVATAGLAARAVAFGLVGWSFVAAAMSHRPGRADGVDDALRDLATSSPGRAALLAVAVGLAAHAAYLVSQVFWRDEDAARGD